MNLCNLHQYFSVFFKKISTLQILHIVRFHPLPFFLSLKGSLILNMTIKEINEFCRKSMIGLLEIEFIEFNEEKVVATMPVNEKTLQPLGYLCGGASLALAETIGSAGSLFLIDYNKFNVFGMQVSANHISSVREGTVIGTGRLIHKGKTTHVWDVEIRSEDGKLISASRVTNAIVEKKQ